MDEFEELQKKFEELDRQMRAMLATAGPLVIEELKQRALNKTYVEGDPLATAFNEGAREVFTELYELLPENQNGQLH